MGGPLQNSPSRPILWQRHKYKQSCGNTGATSDGGHKPTWTATSPASSLFGEAFLSFRYDDPSDPHRLMNKTGFEPRTWRTASLQGFRHPLLGHHTFKPLPVTY